MERRPFGSAGWACMGIVALATIPTVVRADEVQFDTADKVELKGTFYPGSKKSACVILLHKLGGNRQQKGWDDLAQALNKADYAVLSFDFRGHGDSTTVGAGFWRGHNQTLKGASRMATKISYKDFPSSYLPYLANDVAAAKRYLDQQNDAGACNSSNVIVIGAEEGAAIGTLWMATEYYRHKMTKNPFGVLVADRTKLESEDLAAAVWLSIPHKLAGYDVAYWLRGPGNKMRDKIPMVFFFGTKDSKASAAANALFAALKNTPSREKLSEFTRLRGKDTTLAGAELLGKKGLKTEEDITGYLENVMQKRGLKAWVQREPEKGPPLQLVPLQYMNVR
jgi:predicted alpha/beta hydrolase